MGRRHRTKAERMARREAALGTRTLPRNPQKCGICRRMNGRHRQSCAYRDARRAA